MNKRNSLHKLALALVLITNACGCSTVYRLTSVPPAPFISLTAPATAHGFLSTITLPSGDYHAEWEDSRGFYYPTSEEIVVKDIFTTRCEGGLYVRKGTNVPAYYFLIDPKGR